MKWPRNLIQNHEKRNYHRVFKIFLILFAGMIDKYRFFNNQEPIFILKTTHFLDGGTTFYYGPGYEFIDWNILSYDDVKDQSFNYTKKEIRIFPFFITDYSRDEIDITEFEIRYQ